VPGLSEFGGVGVHVSDPGARGGFEAFYDPSAGSLERGERAFLSRTVWSPGQDGEPRYVEPDAHGPSAFEVELTVEPGEDSEWIGRAFLRATGALSPYGSMVGLDDESEGTFGRLARSLLTGSELSGHNVDVLSPREVVAGFAFTLTPDDPDERGRTRFLVGDPSGGILSILAGDVVLHQGSRESPVSLVAPVRQSVILRLARGDGDVLRVPGEETIENQVGGFSVSVEEDDDWITVTRELRIGKTTVEPDRWPELRALLVAETHPRNRTILVK
jgi:hypothetical protein